MLQGMRPKGKAPGTGVCPGVHSLQSARARHHASPQPVAYPCRPQLLWIEPVTGRFSARSLKGQRCTRATVGGSEKRGGLALPGLMYHTPRSTAGSCVHPYITTVQPAPNGPMSRESSVWITYAETPSSRAAPGGDEATLRQISWPFNTHVTVGRTWAHASGLRHCGVATPSSIRHNPRSVPERAFAIQSNWPM